MAVEWLNENENRSYPFVDAGLADIPDEIVVDMVLTGPATDIEGAYLSSFVVHGSLISLAVASPSAGALAVFTANAPDKYRPYGLTPIRDGVGGYLSFGIGIEADIDLDRRNLAKSPIGIDPGCLKPLNDKYVSSLGKYGIRDDQALRGVVKLEVGNGVTLEYQEGVISIGLTDEASRELVPKCATKAVFDECGSPPIRKINSVEPDEDGKIILEFVNG